VTDTNLFPPPARIDTIDPAGRIESQYRARFDSVVPFTVGAEEEFLLVDPHTCEPVPLIEQALDLVGGDSRVAPELRACMIELITPVCLSVGDVARELASARALVAERLRGTALLVGVGTHPTAAPGSITSLPRYAELAADNPWSTAWMLSCGLHVHVAIGGADRTLAVYNALRSYLPEIVAVAANAPFYRGTDSGLATVRPKLHQTRARSGIPPAFQSWRDVAEFVAWSRTGGVVPDPSHHWWDLRLHPVYGTVEVRAADTQTRTEDSAAVVALVQSLVCELASRWDDGEELPVHREERIVENMWMATRDGIAGSLVDLDSGERRPTADRIHQLTERLLPTASSLGCDDELLHLGRLTLEGGGAGRQRRIARRLGIAGLLTVLADETVTRRADDLTGLQWLPVDAPRAPHIPSAVNELS
jgi:glutamate---cysteine ligase / carboxylate-amine ligase